MTLDGGGDGRRPAAIDVRLAERRSGSRTDAVRAMACRRRTSRAVLHEQRLVDADWRGKVIKKNDGRARRG